MRRKMSNGKVTLIVTEHLMTRNFWEYYVLESPTNTKDIKQCLVLGYENEIGDVSMSEIKPFLISKTNKLDNVAPAPNWDWL